MKQTLRHARSVVGYIWTNPSNRGQRIRRLITAVQFQLGGRVLGRTTKVVPFGNRSQFLAELHIHNSTRPLYGRVPDYPEMLVWQRVLEPGKLFVDVGANVGIYSVLAAELGATVLSVEPNAEARSRLSANLALNGYDAEVLEFALASEAGTARITNTFDEENRLLFAGTAERSGNENVTTSTLDELLGTRVADGVKIDVEGAERQVLAGATRSLAERRIRLIQMEWNGCAARWFGESRLEVAALLDAAGYELCLPQPDGSLRPVKAPEESAVDLFARPID